MAKGVVVEIAPRCLRIAEAARYLSVTNFFMEEMIRGNRIKYIIAGERRIIDVKQLDAWVEKQQALQAIEQTKAA